MKKFLNKFRGAYFRAVYCIADRLFVGDKCPNCGTELKLNGNGLGKCQSLYCPKCVEYNTTSENRIKAVWTFEELRTMPGFTRDVIKEQHKAMRESHMSMTPAKKIRAKKELSKNFAV